APAQEPRRAADQTPPGLRELFTLLHEQVGHDFRPYKRPTLLRRIGRRLQALALPDIPAYVEYLHRHPAETRVLMDDMLITVTSFFRDAEAFRVLQREAIPKLLARRREGESVRVWVAGCATGEEAYSIAMLLLEQAWQLAEPRQIQVFATDMDERAIATARAGRYSEAALQNLAAERLHRFFVPEESGYRVTKSLREAVLFSPHNVLRDPPFCKVDLVSCRNLLIYLNRETQEQILAMFHYALRPAGFLFLGSSESAECLPDLFAPLDKKSRLYVVRPVAKPSHHLTRAHWPPFGLTRPDDGKATVPGGKNSLSFTELHHKAIERFMPPSVLIDGDYNVVYLGQGVGRFLRLARGEPTPQLFQIVHESLQPPLRAALFAAKAKAAQGVVDAVESVRARAELDGGPSAVVITARTLAEGPEQARNCFLVFFEALNETPADKARGESLPAIEEASPRDLALGQLEEELRQIKERLRATIEQYETSTEELKASNEELQAINEELRSATEELETSKEELQSVNEELTTVNHDYLLKIEEVTRANNHLRNLIASADIATLFLDRELRIRLHTPGARELFNITPADIGRPLDHFSHKFKGWEFAQDAAAVLDTLQPIQREIVSTGHRWYIVRVLPYRTLDERVDGLVLTFMDITDRKRMEQALRDSERLYRAIGESIDFGVWVCDPTGRNIYASESFLSLVGLTQEECSNFGWGRALRPGDAERTLAAWQECVRTGGAWDIEHRFLGVDGRYHAVLARGVPVRNDVGEILCWAGINLDIHRLKAAEAELRESESRTRQVLESLPQLVWTCAAEGGCDYLSPQWVSYTGVPEEAQLGYGWLEQIHPDDREAVAGQWNRMAAQGLPFEVEFRIRRADGVYRWFQTRATALRDGRGAIVKWFGANTDVEALKQAQESLREADRRKNEFMAMLSHELRNPLAPIRNAAAVLRAVNSPDPKVLWASELISRQVKHLAHLVDDLLDLSRITRGLIVLKTEPLDLAEVALRAVEIHRPDIEARRHVLEIAAPPEPVWVAGDLTRLEQVVGNLLSNAAKYTEPGGRIHLSAGVAGEWAELRVSDTGVGIPADLLPHVFESFIQGQRSLDRSQGGLGIGLNLVKNLVELHGGTVEARSEGEGCGSEFLVNLPRLVEKGGRPV
ncbi:CheR family methyltransferase, partial [Methylomagnum sp.]